MFYRLKQQRARVGSSCMQGCTFARWRGRKYKNAMRMRLNSKFQYYLPFYVLITWHRTACESRENVTLLHVSNHFFMAFWGSFSYALTQLSHSFAALVMTPLKSSLTSVVSHCSSSQFPSAPSVWLGAQPMASRTSVSVGVVPNAGNSFESLSWHLVARYFSRVRSRGDGVKLRASLSSSWLPDLELELSRLVTLLLVFAPLMLAAAQTPSI